MPWADACAFYMQQGAGKESRRDHDPEKNLDGTTDKTAIVAKYCTNIQPFRGAGAAGAAERRHRHMHAGGGRGGQPRETAGPTRLPRRRARSQVRTGASKCLSSCRHR